jgi:hypothetical protein
MINLDIEFCGGNKKSVQNFGMKILKSKRLEHNWGLKNNTYLFTVFTVYLTAGAGIAQSV